MEAKITDLLKNLLFHATQNVAQKMGFEVITPQSYFTKQNAIESLNLCEGYLNTPAMFEKILKSCHLIWENRESLDIDTKLLTAVLEDKYTKLGLPIAIQTLNKDSQKQTNSIFLLLQQQQMTSSLSVQVGKKQLILTVSQKEYWDLIDINFYTDNKIIGMFAPTSSGKTFLLIHKIIDIFSREEMTTNVIYIAPTIALLTELKDKLYTALEESGIENVAVLTSVTQLPFENLEKTIYILTQERFHELIENSENTTLKKPDILILDEIQNISESRHEENERTESYRRIFIHLSEQKIIPKRLICAGVDKNQDLHSFVLKNIEIKNIERSFDQKTSVVNLAFGIKQEGKKLFFKLIDRDFSDIQLEIRNEFGGRSWKSDNQFSNTKWVKNVYKQINTCLKGESLLYYINGKSTQQTFLSSDYFDFEAITINSNAQSLRCSIQRWCYYPLKNIELLDRGVALHNGDLPKSLKILLEQGFKAGAIKTMVANKTLLQGVNLPVKYLILYSDKQCPLSPTEINNLRGRAGRLGIDLVGYFFYLNYNQGEQKDIKEAPREGHQVLIETEDYSTPYNGEEIDFIVDILEQNTPVSRVLQNREKEKKNILLTICYIRQLALHYGRDGFFKGKYYLHGILKNIYNNTVDKVRSFVDLGSVAVCKKHWTFDPLDIQEIKSDPVFSSAENIIVKSPDKNQLVKNILVPELQKILKEIQGRYRYYYDRYLDVADYGEQRFFAALTTWLSGVPLYSEDFKGEYNPYEFVNRISYKLPQLLSPFIWQRKDRNRMLSTLKYGSIYDLKLLQNLDFLELDRDFILYLKNLYVREEEHKNEEIVDVSKFIEFLIKKIDDPISSDFSWEAKILKHVHIEKYRSLIF